VFLYVEFYCLFRKMLEGLKLMLQVVRQCICQSMCSFSVLIVYIYIYNSIVGGGGIFIEKE
jgi:hypothetical protein